MSEPKMSRFCINCGAAVASGARFCAACGAPADTEATRVAARVPFEPPRSVTPIESPRPPAPVEPPRTTPPPHHPRTTDDIERVIFTTRPTLLFIKLGYVAAAFGAVLLVALLSWLSASVSPLISIPVGMALLLIPAVYHLKRNTLSYKLTDSKIEIDRGFISRTTRNIPLTKIQDVTVSTSVLQRLLRFGDIVIENAGEQESQTVLRNIPNPRRHADLLLRELRRWN